MTAPGTVLRLEHLSKEFGGTRALHDVSLDVAADEVHALLGANGSGKSTLIKVLSGYHRPEPGAVATLGGEPLDLLHPLAARHDAMRFVHQDLGIVLELSAVDNFGLECGYATNGAGRIRWREQVRRTRRALKRFDVGFDIHKPMSDAAPVDRTLVAIAAAIEGWDGAGGLLVLDEPTAALPPGEVGVLFDIIAEVRRAGASVLYVSHRLDEIFEIGDRVTVLRQGEVVATRAVTDLTPHDVAALMVGSEVETAVRPSPRDADDSAPVLEAKDLRGRFLRGVDFTLRPGEILGIAGLLGSGREELPYIVAGAAEDATAGGRIRDGGEAARWHDVARTRRRLALVPADRVGAGMFGELTVQENLAMPSLDALSRHGYVPGSRERALGLEWSDRVGVHPRDPKRIMSTLSGGNQQKVVVGRWLAQRPSVLVLCEPTAGVDIAARMALYRLLINEARAGLGIVLSSSDTDDLLHLCTRVLVLRDGLVARELQFDDISESTLHHAMEGTDR
jgi:ribose transport system ATP-binding protein